MPYVQDEDWDALSMLGIGFALRPAMLAKVSAARCARVSYLTQDGRRDIEEDLRLYDRLTTARPWHGSPLEHVATPWSANAKKHANTFEDINGNWHRIVRVAPLYGNLVGWRQLRLEIEAAQQDIIDQPQED